MATLLPKPQEYSYPPDALAPADGLRAFFSPWTGEDAAGECLAPALACFLGREPAVVEAALPGAPGCAFALATDAAAAAQLVEGALRQMAAPVRTLRLCLDGGNMSEPTDGMGKAEAPAEGIGRLAEAYVLSVGAGGIAIAGTDRAGLFYGVQTLIQHLAGAAGACPGLLVRDFPSQAWRGIHFDMKYTFYRFATLEEQLRRMASLKLNLALFEYEDKFPYRRHPEIVDAERALTPEQVASLRRTAARHHIAIVPLVQTLGHLEFALQHASLAPLREVEDGYTMVCPRRPAAQRFVRDLVEEVLDAHPEARAVHLGGDETSLLGHCPACREHAARHGAVSLWVDHYAALTREVLARGVRPILWDDIVRRDARQAERLPREVVLAYWIYETVRERHGARAVPAALEAHFGCAGRRPQELPDTLSTYPHFDFYRSLGFDVVAAPCFNVGTLVPAFEVVTRNTATWAEKSRLCGGLGMINTWWASFLMHPDAGWYGIAQTADQTWWWPSVNRLDFDARFGDWLFGLRSPEAAECLAACSVGAGFPSKLKRPLSVLSFAYMERMIHYEGSIEMIQKEGGLGIGKQLDVHNHLVRKLELIAEDRLEGEVRRQLDECEPILESALRRLKAIRPRVRRNAEVIDLLALVAELKAARCRHWRFFLDAFGRRAGPPDAAARQTAARLLRRENALRRRYLRLYAAKLCRADAEFNTARHFDGERQFLRGLARGEPIPASRRTRFAGRADTWQDIKEC